MRLSYKRRLSLWFGVIFLIFSTSVIVFEQFRLKRGKTETLEEKLDTYGQIVHNASINNWSLDSLQSILPSNLRISVIDVSGNVVYDNALGMVSTIDNHLLRPEVSQATKSGTGYDIRVSASNNHRYLYYARLYNNHYIRVALPYNIQTQLLLNPGFGFIYFVIAMFVIGLFFISYAASMFGKSIKQLKDFTAAVGGGDAYTDHLVFPNDELGEIGQAVVALYRDLYSSQKQSTQEREKLLQHVYNSEEGVCFFNPLRCVEFYNGLFLQHLNILCDGRQVDPSAIFSNKVFDEVATFLDRRGDQNYFVVNVTAQGKYFAVQANVFDDASFEVIIRDITKQEKTRQLKQQLTGNIAHELRTPVTSIRGYLETVIEQPLDRERERSFITKAYNQALSLSELISDMGLLTKIEEAPNSFYLERVDMHTVVDRVAKDLEAKLFECGISIDNDIAADTMVKGNASLLYSIVRNLTDNVIKYAGANVKIVVNCYNKDAAYYHFSFSDNGVGIVDPQHLNRLFERFYVVDEGRTRTAAGSGLGLSIVRNAVTFHRGTIQVRGRTVGGLEFLFKLQKG